MRDLERVKAHLETCSSCQREYGDLETLRNLLRSLPEPAPVGGFVDRLHWRLEREASLPSRPEIWGRFGARPLRLALACATLLLVLGLPLGWVTGRFVARPVPLDADAYLRTYLVLSVDRPFADDVAATFAPSDVVFPEPQSQ
jgi:anti-sigma factor RsiW